MLSSLLLCQGIYILCVVKSDCVRRSYFLFFHWKGGGNLITDVLVYVNFAKCNKKGVSCLLANMALESSVFICLFVYTLLHCKAFHSYQLYTADKYPTSDKKQKHNRS